MIPPALRHKEAQPGFAAPSCAPSSSSAAALAKAPNSDDGCSIAQAVKTFLRLLYEQQTGWVELAWIDGDPDARMPLERTWLRFGGDHTPLLLQRIARLCARQANVYVSACLYTAPRRSAPVRPTRALVVDDLPADVPCTFAVQTSRDRRQGYYLLTDAVDGDTRRDLARRATYALGGDRGGWDNQQLVRVPGGWNTKAKYGAPFQTRLSIDTRQHRTPAALRAQWPEVSAPTRDGIDLDWPLVQHWLGNMAVLLNDAGLPRRLKPTTQTARVLRAGMADTSLARYIVATGLVLHGYPDAEIAALLLHLCDYDCTARKGSAWLDADVARVIARVRAERPHSVPTPTAQRGSQPPAPRAVIQPLRRGRTRALTPAQLLQFYQQVCHAGEVVMLTVGAVAQQLGVSRATIERCERVLRADGHIRRRPFNRQQSSLVEVLTLGTTADSRPVTMESLPTSEVGAAPPMTPDAADSRPVTKAVQPVHRAPAHVPSAHTALPVPAAENAHPSPHEGTHPHDAPATSPTPRHAVAAAFAHFAQRRRITRQMIQMFLDSAYPTLDVAPAARDRLIRAERERRQWQRQVDALRTMPYPQLARLSRKLERLQVDRLHGQHDARQRWADALGPHVAAELERREPMHDRASPQRVRQQEAECRRLVAADRQQHRTSPSRTTGTNRGCVPPTALPMQHALFAPSATATPSAQRLITNLRARLHGRTAHVIPAPDAVPHGTSETVPHARYAPP